MANEPNPAQGEPEGETVIIPGDEPAPEQETEVETTEAEGDEPAEPEEAAAEPEKPKVSWETRRRIEETNKRRAAEKEATDLRAEVERLKAGREPDPTSLDTAVEARASELVRQQEHAKRVKTWADDGAKTFGLASFNEKCNFLADLGAADRPDFMSIITDPEVTTASSKVVGYLTDNPEEAERILGLSAVKMALEIAKISDKVDKPATPKPVSKAPPPVKPSAGAVETGTRLDDESTPMDAWAKAFLKDVAKRA